MSIESDSEVSLTEYEQDTLELGCGYSESRNAQHEYYVQVARNKSEKDAIGNLYNMKLIEIRSISTTSGEDMVFLIRLTGKGDAVVRS